MLSASAPVVPSHARGTAVRSLKHATNFLVLSRRRNMEDLVSAHVCTCAQAGTSRRTSVLLRSSPCTMTVKGLSA